jgi:hypothetical protein
MFEVRITPEAGLNIERAIASHEGPKAGLMIHRQGPVGDVSRALDGGVEWKIERPHPWVIQVGSYASIPDDDENIMFVDGVRIWLPLIPRPGELGVVVLVREGQLHVEAIDV